MENNESESSSVPETKVSNYFVVVPVDDEPIFGEYQNLDDFLKNLYKTLIDSEKGWAFVFVDGKKCKLSNADLRFSLELVDKKVIELSRVGGIEFKEDNAFSCVYL